MKNDYNFEHRGHKIRVTTSVNAGRWSWSFIIDEKMTGDQQEDFSQDEEETREEGESAAMQAVDRIERNDDL
jgi:hypothetical protein